MWGSTATLMTWVLLGCLTAGVNARSIPDQEKDVESFKSDPLPFDVIFLQRTDTIIPLEYADDVRNISTESSIHPLRNWTTELQSYLLQGESKCDLAPLIDKIFDSVRLHTELSKSPKEYITNELDNRSDNTTTTNFEEELHRTILHQEENTIPEYILKSNVNHNESNMLESTQPNISTMGAHNHEYSNDSPYFISGNNEQVYEPSPSLENVYNPSTSRYADHLPAENDYRWKMNLEDLQNVSPSNTRRNYRTSLRGFLPAHNEQPEVDAWPKSRERYYKKAGDDTTSQYFRPTELFSYDNNIVPGYQEENYYPFLLTTQDVRRKRNSETESPSSEYFDGIIDFLLELVKEAFRTTWKGKINLPNITKSFSRFSIRGHVKAWDGWLLGADSLRRSDSVNVYKKDNIFIIGFYLVFDTLKFGYEHYQAKFLLWEPSGSVEGSVKNAKITIKLNVTVLNDDKCDLTMAGLNVTELNDIQVRMTGLGQLSARASKITTWTAKHMKVRLMAAVSRYVRQAIEGALTQVPCSPYIVTFLQQAPQ